MGYASSNIFGAVWVLLSALVAAALLGLLFGSPNLGKRFSTIDGLRGYLALAVFIHHASIWHVFAGSGEWKTPASLLYGQLGEVGVAFFFMITAFLFTQKLASSKSRGVDWLAMYVSRIMRLTPLYFVAVFLLLIVVLVCSDGVWRERASASFPRLAAWLLFAIPGAWDINQVKNTALIMAGVTWSFAYEWFFYLLLPVIAIFIGIKPKWSVVIATAVVMILMLVVWRPNFMLLLTFGGGGLATWVQRSEKLEAFCKTPFASVVVLTSLSAEFFLFKRADGVLQLALLSICFILIACGTDVFGALTASVSRVLGELAYGIYLIHGLLLFVAFTFVIGTNVVSQMSPSTYWGVVAVLAQALIAVCYLLFLVVERPGMAASPKLTQWLLRRIKPRQNLSV